MTFPVVDATNTGQNDSSDVTSHTVTLPSGVSSGDTLLVFFAAYGAPTISFPGGWTKELEASRATDVTLAIGSFVASGGETSITVSTVTACRSSYTCFRISGAGTITVGTASTGSATGPNAPALSGLTSDDYLFLAPLAFQQNATVSSYPSNCANNRLSIAGGGATSVTAAVATANSTGTSFDPFGYTMSAAHPYVVVTVAVAPSSGTTYNETLAVSLAAAISVVPIFVYSASLAVSAAAGITYSPQFSYADSLAVSSVSGISGSASMGFGDALGLSSSITVNLTSPIVYSETLIISATPTVTYSNIHWSSQSQGGESWASQSQGGESWTNQSQGGEGWSDQPQGGEAWTTQSKGNETWH